MLKLPTLIVIAGLIVAGAVVNGMATQRWSAFAPDPAVTERLTSRSVRFEDWHPTEVPTEMPTNERSEAVSQRYTSASSGRSAVVTLIHGVPGSVSTHTPDVCYPSSGYTTLRGPAKDTTELPGGATAEFYVADFEKRTATRRDRVRVRWAWATDGTWVAPDNPRWRFATELVRVPVLYKVYIVTPLAADPDAADLPADDPTTRAFVSTVFSQYSAAFNQ